MGVFMSLEDIERIAKRYKTLMAYRMLEAIEGKTLPGVAAILGE